MPDISQNGKILFSIFENSKYKIAILDTINLIKDNQIGYASINNVGYKCLYSKIKNKSKSFMAFDEAPPVNETFSKISDEMEIRRL